MLPSFAEAATPPADQWPRDLGREFRPRVSCWHFWRPIVDMDERTGAGEITGREECDHCGATCERDPETQTIVHYETVESRIIAAEQIERKRAEGASPAKLARLAMGNR